VQTLRQIAVVATLALCASALSACGGGSGKASEARITDGDADNICYQNATISADGTKLLYQSDVYADGVIMTEEFADGKATGVRSIVPGTKGGSWPGFLDGGKLAYVEATSSESSHIVVKSFDGSGARTIEVQGDPHQLSVSPDGEWLYYDVIGTGEQTIRRVRVDGTGDAAVLTDTTVDWPVASPDGAEIAYVRTPDGGDSSEIWVAKTDGSARRKIAEGNSPAWSPDGKQLAYLGSGGNASDGLPLTEIFVVSMPGGTPTEITTSRAPKMGLLTWLPDHHVAYVYEGATDEYCQLFSVAIPAPDA